jgi:hypothetical protein
MKDPCLLTLTINRENWLSPELAHERAVSLIPDLLRHLGIRLWVRVVEPQTASGNGWLHYHILVDLPRTPGMTKGQALGACSRHAWSLWRDTWACGGVDLQPRKKSKGALAGYLSKYIVKPWEAIPEWMLRSTRKFRCISFSKRAADLLHHMGIRERRRSPRTRLHRRRRPTRPLLDRIASVGSTVQVFRRRGDGTLAFAGTLPAPLGVLVAHQVPGVQLVARSDRPDRTRAVPVLRGSVAEVRRRCSTAQIQADARRWLEERKASVLHAWDRSQCVPVGTEGVGCSERGAPLMTACAQDSDRHPRR